MSDLSKKVQVKIDDIMNENEEDFEKLLDEYENKDENTTIVSGKIVKIENDEVFIDIGKKSESILPIDEIKNNDELLYNIGDEIQVAIVGNRKVSYKKALRKQKVQDFIKNYTSDQDEQSFQVKIISENKNGFVCVDEVGVEFFLPKSQYLFKKTNNVINKKIKVQILKVNKEESSIIISYKKNLENERKKYKELIDNILKSNESIEGIVRKVTNYGMFVDIGGVDGLVHYSEISYKGPVNPISLYKEGDKVTVKVINYNQDKKHLSLSIKATQPDPWSEIKDSLEVGDTIKVVVSNIESYGAFVDLGNDIEGFLHISEISWNKNIKNPKDYIEKGQELDVEVIEINTNERRLRVSLRNLLAKPFDLFLKTHKNFDIVKGTVSSITNFGAFVNLGSIEGLLHNEDYSWDKSIKCKDELKLNDEIEVKIIKIDKENQKISLSKKELIQSPVQAYIKRHKINDIVKGTIRDIKEFGIFVQLESNVDALIHKDDINTNDFENLKIKDEVEASIVHFDEKRNRIRLSVKNLVRLKEREILNKINIEDRVTLGDIIKEQLS